MSTPTPVTLIGLGPMGQAMVRTLLAAGHPVTVWNRTPSRADALVAEGATRAATPRRRSRPGRGGSRTRRGSRPRWRSAS